MLIQDIKKEIDKLTLSEKLSLVEDVWESIARNNDLSPLPEWQKHELEKRYEEYKAGQMELTDWKTVRDEIITKYQTEKTQDAHLSDFKKEFHLELADISEQDIPELLQIIRSFKENRKKRTKGFSNLNRWRGGLKDLKLTSVELQHQISEIWRKKYVSD
jgi:putative addiction module component (TIGR02574 family)